MPTTIESYWGNIQPDLQSGITAGSGDDMRREERRNRGNQHVAPAQRTLDRYQAYRENGNMPYVPSPGFLEALFPNLSGYNARLAQYQNDYNLWMYNKQLADQRENWRMENEYNTPANQVGRYQDAGLSTALMYGQGSSGNAGSISATEGKGAEAYSLDAAMSKIAGIADTFMNLKMKKAQIGKIEEETHKTHMEWVNKAEENEAKYTNYQSMANMAKSQLSAAQVKELAEIESVIANASTAKSKASAMEKYVQWFETNAITNILRIFMPLALKAF